MATCKVSFTGCPYSTFKVMIGGSFNRFFEISDKGFYVARITKVDECLHILLYRPMIASDFGNSIEVDYAKEII